MTATERTPSIARFEPEGGLLANAVAAGGLLVCVSMADDPGLDIAGQGAQSLAYIDHCLSLAGLARDRLVQVTILLADIRDRAAMDTAWIEWLGTAGRPARACVQAKLADPRLLVEIVAVAAVRNGPAHE